jgi:hypothetical protein
VCARDRALLKKWLASVLKTAVGRRMNYFKSSENQHIKITFYILMGAEDHKRYIKIMKIGIIFCGRLATFGTTTFHLCFPYQVYAETACLGTNTLAYFAAASLTKPKSFFFNIHRAYLSEAPSGAPL